MNRFFVFLTAFGALIAHGATLTSAEVAQLRQAGETLAGVLDYQGGFSKLDLGVTTKDLVKSFRVAIPKFCKDVEILEAGTITEGIYDEAKLAVEKDHAYNVNGGAGSRISGVRVSLNGPQTPSCSVPIFLSSKKATETSEEPDPNIGTGTPLRTNFCNRAHQTAWIAVGYRSNQKWMATGWWKLNPGECNWVTVKGDPTYSVYFYGKSASGTFWGQGHASFCVKDAIFTAGDAACQAGQGYWAPMTRMTRAYDGNRYMDLTD